MEKMYNQYFKDDGEFLQTITEEEKKEFYSVPHPMYYFLLNVAPDITLLELA